VFPQIPLIIAICVFQLHEEEINKTKKKQNYHRNEAAHQLLML
jgi:hypothetical protein